MSEQTFSGSCLCGKTAYDIQGDVQAFFHCHCRRCRKASGTGHASNIIVRYSKQSWNRGEELLRRYNVPEAKRFHALYCNECGSPMPRVSAETGIAVIPAGSLDNSPELAVTGRIFQDSRTEWSCSSDELPKWDQYPDRS